MLNNPPPIFQWCAAPVVFRPGETLAAALQRQGIVALGGSAGGLQGRYFCGIGTCQACLISVDGASATEACLTRAQAGMQVTPAGSGFFPASTNRA